MNSKIVKKFFNNQATPEETQDVLDWFETAEGKQYLKERLDVDAGLMDRRELRDMVPELKSDKLFDSIKYDIRRKNNVFSIRRNDWLGYTVKAAASILVILTASFFAITQQRYEAEQVVEIEPIIFQTEEEQNREIKLGDGTMVRLNSNSTLIVSNDFMNGDREVTLTGEGYFDVAHDTEHPFVIRANRSTIEVLGTAFNVRSLSHQDNDQVAVVDGKVSFKNASLASAEQIAVILSKGQYGYLDNTEGTIEVDEIAVDNYLAWRSGELIFEDLTLGQVCVQLNRLYSIECSYKDEEIKNFHLTANFSDESLEKTLSVIGLSLDLEFVREDDQVTWEHSSLISDQ
ncbi:MAG: FecR domain-containing protein [Balneolaceae bacterium]